MVVLKHILLEILLPITQPLHHHRDQQDLQRLLEKSKGPTATMYYRPADELFFREINFTEKIYGAKQQHFHILL